MRLYSSWIFGFTLPSMCESDAFIFSHCDNFWKYNIYFLRCIFLLEAVTYQHNLIIKFYGWGCTPPEYLGSHFLQCVKPSTHPVSLKKSVFESLTHKLLHILGCCCEHRDTEAYWFLKPDQTMLRFTHYIGHKDFKNMDWLSCPHFQHWELKASNIIF